MEDTNYLLQRLEAIEKRNVRVEMDKKWETSLTRITIISLMTYIVAAVFLFSTKLPYPFLNAFVPAIGYLLSMQSLPFVKAWYARRTDSRVE